MKKSKRKKNSDDMNDRTINIDVNDACGTLLVTTEEYIPFQVHMEYL